jgi:mRNA interferase RelE/StbE
MGKLYSVEITATAKKQLTKLPLSIADRLIKAIQELAKNPRPTEGTRNLKADRLQDRGSDYRIIYEIYDAQLIVNVVTVGNRKEVYE